MNTTFIEESERLEALANGIFTIRSKPKATLKPSQLKRLKARLSQK